MPDDAPSPENPLAPPDPTTPSETPEHNSRFGPEPAELVPPPEATPPDSPAPPVESAPPPAPAAPEAPPPPAPPIVAAAPPAEPEDPDAPPEQRGKRPTWKMLRQAEQDRKALEERLTRAEQDREADRRRLEQALNPTPPAQDTPGVTRPFTQAELTALREDDVIEYSRVVSEMSIAESRAAQAQTAQLQRELVVRDQINDFKVRQPDYTEAVQYLETRERARLVASGIPEQFVEPMLIQRTGMLIEAATQQKRNVAEVAYAVAVADGWAAPAAPTPLAAVPPVLPPSTPASQTPQDKVLASLQRSRAAEGSIGSIPGSSGARPMITREQIQNASQADMDRWTAEDPNWEQNAQA